jgi:hypothetical protein
MMTLDKKNALMFAHKANIERYQNILATYLTTEQRCFVHRRLAEEQTDLQQHEMNHVG